MSNTKPKSWRDQLPIHPAAELFPLMSEPELRELGENIKANGYLTDESVALYEGKLLDGRNRLDALELIGVKYDNITQQKGIIHDLNPSIDPYAYVISKNIHRRHLTVEQKRELIAKVIAADPTRSDRQIAKQTKTSPTTVGKIRKESEATGDVSKLDTRTDTKGRKQPSAKPKKPAAKAKAEEILDEIMDFVLGEASPVKNDPIGSPPGRDSGLPATSVPPKSERGSVSAKDIALEDFSARAMELVRLTQNKSAKRFAKTAVSDDDIRHLAKFFGDLLVARADCRAEHAVIDDAADDDQSAVMQ
jgi:hypothetical protein